MEKKDYLPIILGSDENAYGTARLFSEFCPEKPLMLCTRQLVPTMYSHLCRVELIPDFDKETVFPSALLRVLHREQAAYEKFVVISCSDYYTNMLSRHFAEFEGLIANPYLSPDLLVTLDTKDRFYALCEKHGMDYPKTVVAEPEQRLRVAEELPFSFPIVVKPENSNAYEYLHCQFEGKQKVFFFQSKEEYLQMVRSMNTSDYRGKLILQEFIPGGDDAMRVMNSYSDPQATVRMMCLGQPVLEYYDPKTAGNYAAILTRSDPEVYRRLQQFLQEIGYVGFCNIDMKYDRNTGRYVLFEINPRLGRSSFCVRSAGYNMMKILVDDVIYHRPQECTFSQTTGLWSNVPRGILRKYVKDPQLQKELRRHKILHTLYLWSDMSLKRLYRISRYYFAQYRSFRKYYFDKEP